MGIEEITEEKRVGLENKYTKIYKLKNALGQYLSLFLLRCPWEVQMQQIMAVYLWTMINTEEVILRCSCSAYSKVSLKSSPTHIDDRILFLLELAWIMLASVDQCSHIL